MNLEFLANFATANGLITNFSFHLQWTCVVAMGRWTVWCILVITIRTVLAVTQGLCEGDPLGRQQKMNMSLFLRIELTFGVSMTYNLGSSATPVAIAGLQNPGLHVGRAGQCEVKARISLCLPWCHICSSWTPGQIVWLPAWVCAGWHHAHCRLGRIRGRRLLFRWTLDIVPKSCPIFLGRYLARPEWWKATFWNGFLPTGELNVVSLLDSLSNTMLQYPHHFV